MLKEDLMAEPSTATPILMPQAGNSMEEGTILAWRVKPGDAIKPGDVLFEVETDKATVEVEAEVAGVIGTIIAPEGATIPVKHPVAYLADGIPGFASAPAAPVEVVASAPAPSQVVTASPGDVLEPTRKRVSPVARRAAGQLGVDVESIPTGSGPDGRVLLQDVELAARAKPAAPQSAREPFAPPSALPEATRAMPGGTRAPMSKMRRAIGRNLQRSKQTVPHWTSKVTLDAGPLLEYVKRQKQHFPCSVNDAILAAVARVVMEMPSFRSQVDGDDLVTFDGAHIGIAVAQDQGLVVPVLKNADRLSLKGISEAARALTSGARSGKVDGMGEGVFTISNLGMFGLDEFEAIINPPESAILAVGAIKEDVIVKDGAMRAGKTLTLTLSADHRVIDGVDAAKFLVRLRELLQEPIALGGV